MSKRYAKWRELSIDPFTINFKNIVIKDIISYPPAGNDVVECKCIYKKKLTNAFIKIERSKMANFEAEETNISLLLNSKYYEKIPRVYESCMVDEKKILVLEKITGERISDIFAKHITSKEKKDYLIKYGRELALIHAIPIDRFNKAMKRVINDYPKEEKYGDFDKSIKPYIEYLKDNKPHIIDNSFIHGDFHYANILWKNNEVNGVLDFEYSGLGFKEQDIAWSLILRPTQHFMDNTEDIKYFLEGYKTIGEYNTNDLKWCLINGYCHFYLMNICNEKYKEQLLNLIINVEKGGI